ncbi:MAG: acyltransferase [Bacteroidia bacterium]|nr:acyltransferase [Bacteroidia bacterium]
MKKNPLHTKTYFENLDSLRFLAALTVVISHCQINFNYVFSNKVLQILHLHFFKNGSLGVNFFFVLSGFLISWLLLMEKEKRNTVDLINFYKRRVLRIWPVYFIVVIIGFYIGSTCDFPFITNQNFNYRSDLTQVKWYVTFLANYAPGNSNFLISQLWSVSVEEQFYFFWPILFLFVNKKQFLYCCFLIVIISFIYKIYDMQRVSTYVSTPFVMSDLAFGGLICYYAMYHQAFFSSIKNLSKKSIYAIYIVLICYTFLHGFSHIFGEKIFLLYSPFESILFAILFSLVILEQNFSDNSFYKFGKINLFNRLGKISYGIYAYHMLTFPIAFYIASLLPFNDLGLLSYLIKTFTVIICTICISLFSYHFIEVKFLSLKNKSF